jgi:hypothetical protein
MFFEEVKRTEGSHDERKYRRQPTPSSAQITVNPYSNRELFPRIFFKNCAKSQTERRKIHNLEHKLPGFRKD